MSVQVYAGVNRLMFIFSYLKRLINLTLAACACSVFSATNGNR